MKLKRKDIIVKCRADIFMPLAAMFGIYVIMHGDSSPAAASRAAFWQPAPSCCSTWVMADGRTTSTIRRATSPPGSSG